MNIKSNLSIFVLSSVLILLSCNKEKKTKNTTEAKIQLDTYRISGNIKNIQDSTWIYINKDNKIIDSTQILNEEFEFKGSVDEPSQFFMMVGRINREYFYLWAENLEIKIEGEKGNLKKASITAGETQKESEISRKRSDSLELAFEKVINQFDDPNADEMTEEVRNNLIKKQNDILAEMSKTSQQFVREFPDSYVSANLLQIFNTSWDKKVITELYDNLSNRIKKSKNGKKIEHFLSLPETPEVGEKYIDFELPDTSGKLVKLSDIKGKYILVEFWASWCGPCIEANPKLVKTYNQYKDKGFNIIGVSLDNNKKHWLKAIEKDHLPWVNVGDLKGDKTEVSLIYGVTGIPDNFLIDEKGKIIAKTLRGNQLENKLKELFK